MADDPDAPPPNEATTRMIVGMAPIVDAMKGFSSLVAGLRMDLEANGFSQATAEEMVVPTYHALTKLLLDEMIRKAAERQRAQ